MWATGPVSASLTCISDQCALGWVWFDLAEPLPRPSWPSSCCGRARPGCGQEGGRGGQWESCPCPARPWLQPSPLLALTRDGAGLDSEPHPRQVWGLSPSHSSSLLSPHILPQGASMPW